MSALRPENTARRLVLGVGSAETLPRAHTGRRRASRRAGGPPGVLLAVGTPRQLVVLQDVLCLVVDQAASLAHFVFSHSDSWLGAAKLG